MGKAAVGTWVGAGRTGRMLSLSAALLVVMVITLATLLVTASPPAAPASSGIGENPPVMGVGGEHYGEGWNNYGHNPPVIGADGEHYGERWNNYGHALDQPRTVR